MSQPMKMPSRLPRMKAITMKREMGSWGEENSRNCNAMLCWFSSMKSIVDSATSNRTMISTARLSHCMPHHPHPLSMPGSIAQHCALLYRTSGSFQRLVDPITQLLARLEVRYILAFKGNRLPRLGVTADPGSAVMKGETAEPADFYTLSGRQRRRHVFQHGLDCQLYILGRQLPLLLLDYALDQLRLGHHFPFLFKRVGSTSKVVPRLCLKVQG